MEAPGPILPVHLHQWTGQLTSVDRLNLTEKLMVSFTVGKGPWMPKTRVFAPCVNLCVSQYRGSVCNRSLLHNNNGPLENSIQNNTDTSKNNMEIQSLYFGNLCMRYGCRVTMHCTALHRTAWTSRCELLGTQNVENKPFDTV